MTENLRLGDPTKEITLTPADSNVAENFVLPVGENGAVIEPAWSVNEAHVYTNNKATKGALYNFYTAGAGSQTSDQTTTLTQSICPKGFTLPASGDYRKLVSTTYGISFFFGPADPDVSYVFNYRLLDFPLNFTFNGWIQGVAAGRGREYPNHQSNYLTSRAYDGNYAERSSTFFFSDVSDYMAIIESFGRNKASGSSIRCIAQ